MGHVATDVPVRNWLEWADEHSKRAERAEEALREIRGILSSDLPHTLKRVGDVVTSYFAEHDDAAS